MMYALLTMPLAMPLEKIDGKNLVGKNLDDPSCPIDFALLLDESYSMNRWKDDNGRKETDEGINQPNYMDGPNGVKEFAKELVRHAAMKPR